MILNYKKIGEQGAPLFVLHGLYGSSDNWLSIGRQLAAHYQVYLVDLRNHGRSFHDLEHTYQAMATDIAWLLKDEEIEHASIMGHSMGGKVAMTFAALYPEMTTQLIVLDIAPINYMAKGVETGQYRLHQQLLRAMASVDFSSVSNLRDLDAILATEIPDRALRQFLMKNVTKKRETGYDWRLNIQVIIDWLEHIVSGCDDVFFSDKMPITNYQVLFINGGDSEYIQPQNHDTIYKIYPEAKLFTINNAGHWLHAQQPDELVRLIVENRV